LPGLNGGGAAAAVPPLHIENTILISCEIIFKVLRPIWSWYLNITDTFCQFCGIYGINDLQSRLQVIRGRDFGTNQKWACDFLL